MILTLKFDHCLDCPFCVAYPADGALEKHVRAWGLRCELSTAEGSTWCSSLDVPLTIPGFCPFRNGKVPVVSRNWIKYRRRVPDSEVVFHVETAI